VTANRFFIGVVLLGVIVLLNLPLPVSMRVKAASRDNLAPFQNVMSFLIRKVQDGVSLAVKGGAAVGEKREMRKEIARLHYEIRRLKALERHNEELRRLLDFKKSRKHQLVMCEMVVRGDTSGWWQTVRLNRGSAERIGPDMAVITEEGLVGKTIEVSRHTCDVLLITDPTCGVASKVLRTGAFGIVRGTGVAPVGDPKLEMLCAVQHCRMDFISKYQKVLEGDEVVTSGLGGVFPEGLLVGRVARAEVDRSRLYQRADIVPTARIEALKYAFVVVDSRAPAKRGH